MPSLAGEIAVQGSMPEQRHLAWGAGQETDLTRGSQHENQVTSRRF